MADQCTKCGQTVVLGHQISLDGRLIGRLCCLCASELMVSLLNGKAAAGG